MKKNLLQFAVGVAIIAAFFLWVGADKVISAVSRMNAIYLLPIFALMAVSIILNAMNIYIFTSRFMKISLKEAIEINLLSWAAGLIALGKFGQLSQIYLLKKKGMSIGDATAVTITDKSITLAVLSTFAVFGAALFLGNSAINAIIILAVTIAAVAFMFFSDFGRGIIKFFLRKHSALFTGFSKAQGRLFRSKAIFANIIVTITTFFCDTLILLLLLRSFGANADFMELALINALTRTISYIPITFSGLGLKEGSFTILAGYLGVDKIIALSAMSVATAIDYALVAAITLFFSKKQIDKVVKEGGEA